VISNKLKDCLLIGIIITACWFLGASFAQHQNKVLTQQWLRDTALTSIESSLRPYWVSENNLQSIGILKQLGLNFKSQIRAKTAANLNMEKATSTLSIYSIGPHIIGESRSQGVESFAHSLIINDAKIPITFHWYAPLFGDNYSWYWYSVLLFGCIAVYWMWWPQPVSRKAIIAYQKLHELDVPKSLIASLLKKNQLESVNINTFELLKKMDTLDVPSIVRLSSLPKEKINKLKACIKQEIPPLEAEVLIKHGEKQDLDISWYQHLRSSHNFDVEDAVAWSSSSHAMELQLDNCKVTLGGIEGNIPPKEFSVLVVMAQRLLSEQEPLSLPGEDCADIELGKELAEIYEGLKGCRQNTLTSFLKGVHGDEVCQSVSKLGGLMKKIVNNDDLSARFICKSEKDESGTHYSLKLSPENISISN